MYRNGLKIYNAYIIINKIYNVVFILLFSFLFFLLNVLIFGTGNIDYATIIHLILLAVLAAFIYTDDQSYSIIYAVIFIIFMIILLGVPTIEKIKTSEDMLTVALLVFPIFMLSLEAIRYGGISVYFLKIKDFWKSKIDYFKINKELKKQKLNMSTFKTNTLHYDVLEIKRDALLDRMVNEFKDTNKKAKILKEELLDNKKSIERKIIEIKEKISINISEKDITESAFQKYYLQEENAKLNEELKEAKERLVKIIKKIDELEVKNEAFYKNTICSIKKICNDFDIRRNYYMSFITKDLSENLKIKINKPFKKYEYNLEGGN